MPKNCLVVWGGNTHTHIGIGSRIILCNWLGECIWLSLIDPTLEQEKLGKLSLLTKSGLFGLTAIGVFVWLQIIGQSSIFINGVTIAHLYIHACSR